MPRCGCRGRVAGGYRMADSRAIAQHGVIGDLRTCALVGTDGTVDWFCAPRFDSPSVFGAILDPDVGGSWRLHPVGDDIRTHQFYFPEIRDTDHPVPRRRRCRRGARLHADPVVPATMSTGSG